MAQSYDSGEEMTRRSDLTVQIRSATKDSLGVVWRVPSEYDDHPSMIISGYKVRYQAIGSTVVQWSHMLQPTTAEYDITQLHENTYYDVCVNVFTAQLTDTIDNAHAAQDVTDDHEAAERAFGNSHQLYRQTASGPGSASNGSFGNAAPTEATTTACVTASTGINSLSVALGSTFGAFLALGVIVAFVLIAKYQHIRRKRKSIQIQLLQRSDASFEALYAAAMATTGDDDLDQDERPTINGTIELKRLSRQATLGRVPDEEEEDAEEGAATGAGDTVPGSDIDSRSSDFSADIILHDTVVQAATGGYPVSLHSQELPAGRTTDVDPPQPLVLDSATCAGSFILANDNPSGRTYSLLVPITSPAVQPLLGGSEAPSGGPRVLRIASGCTPVGGGTSGGGQSIVRLKLRKHATVDYSTAEDDRKLSVGGPRPSSTERQGGRNEDQTAARAQDSRGPAVHRMSVCCGPNPHSNPSTTVHLLTAHAESAERRMIRSLSNDW